MKKLIFIHTHPYIGNKLASNLYSLNRSKNLLKYNSYIGVICYNSRDSVVSLKNIIHNKYQNGLIVISKAIEESHLLKKYPNIKTIVLK